MAKKTLLSEGSIRKFMKLAAIEPLTENFLAEVEEEEEVGEEMDGGEEMEPPKEMEGEEEMGDEEEMEMSAPEAEDALMGIAEKLQELAAALGVDMTVKGSAGDDESLEEGYMTEEDEDLYEELNESVKVVDTQAVVKEVSRRVAQRLIKEAKQEQLAEALARKIAARLR